MCMCVCVWGGGGGGGGGGSAFFVVVCTELTQVLFGNYLNVRGFRLLCVVCICMDTRL